MIGTEERIARLVGELDRQPLIGLGGLKLTLVAIHEGGFPRRLARDRCQAGTQCRRRGSAQEVGGQAHVLGDRSLHRPASQPIVEPTVADDGLGQLVQGSRVQHGGFHPTPDGLPGFGPREEPGCRDAKQERAAFHEPGFPPRVPVIPPLRQPPRPGCSSKPPSRSLGSLG